ncbi:MAG: succinylglutamate desuccinylase/aspartoacylase family protein [Hyphomicrobiales bacterium]
MALGPAVRSRRNVLALLAGSASVALVGCGGEPATARFAGEEEAPATATPPRPSPTPPAAATPTPSPTPPPVGRSSRTLLPGTPSETELVITHSGVAGPRLMVLGGVHGNEPGGWLAAEQVATWTPSAGSLIVLPRANVQAIAGFVRTTDEIGDLNRLYPGSLESSLLMERMAAEIVGVAREFAVDVLLDLHESWAFYAGRVQDGTAFLGQTVSSGVGPRNPVLARAIIERTNAGIDVERELLVERDGRPFARNDNTTDPRRGRSSLSLGGHVPGLTPILVEMGQEGQAVERRVELHLMVARATLAELGMA